MSTFCKALMTAGGILTGLLLLQTYLWPFNRTALLIPLAWWTMYLLNRWKVTTPVLGMVDLVAERAGYYPVPAKKPQKASCERIIAWFELHLRWVLITALGVPVEPEVNRRLAMVSGPTAA